MKIINYCLTLLRHSKPAVAFVGLVPEGVLSVEGEFWSYGYKINMCTHDK